MASIQQIQKAHERTICEVFFYMMFAFDKAPFFTSSTLRSVETKQNRTSTPVCRTNIDNLAKWENQTTSTQNIPSLRWRRKM